MKKLLEALLCLSCSFAFSQSADDLLNKKGNADNVTVFEVTLAYAVAVNWMV